uniref:Nucleoside phosphorylase domain-containing protein n=1 Tax=Ciona savignyi TaxID=51511 RepID=H2YGD5_CIOSA
MEMESGCFAAMCGRAGVKCGIICVTMVDRLVRDNITGVQGSGIGCQMKDWEMLPQTICLKYIMESMGSLTLSPRSSSCLINLH